MRPGRTALRWCEGRLAHLSGADLSTANLYGADLGGSGLSGANLQAATLASTDLTGADLTGCLIYGVSAWRLKLDTKTKQQNLVITHPNEPTITVDNIEIALLIYLLLRNEKIRDVIDTITSKAMLILGVSQMSERPSSTPFARNCENRERE